MPDKDNFNAVIYSSSKVSLFTSAEKEKAGALLATDYKDPPIVNDTVNLRYSVRRLTPRECERLQGYPDDWTLIGEPEWEEVKDYGIVYDMEGNVVTKTEVGSHMEQVYYYTNEKGKRTKVTDSARYKALGNSIALPFWRHLIHRISHELDGQGTLLSLFDGIGGFPLLWEEEFGKGTAMFASEIEDFPIAVTKQHFPENWRPRPAASLEE